MPEIEDIMETFDCGRQTAEEIKQMIKELAIEGFEEQIEEDIPF
ncbi:MAG: hypothetical protein ACOC80_13010 [Petrotogales bacterium]